MLLNQFPQREIEKSHYEGMSNSDKGLYDLRLRGCLISKNDCEFSIPSYIPLDSLVSPALTGHAFQLTVELSLP
jgi:hypothetical protein